MKWAVLRGWPISVLLGTNFCVRRQEKSTSSKTRRLEMTDGKTSMGEVVRQIGDQLRLLEEDGKYPHDSQALRARLEAIMQFASQGLQDLDRRPT